MPYRVCLVGLGLMGGSMAYALKGFRDCEIVGADSDPDVCTRVLRAGAVSRAYGDAAEAVSGASLVIFCVYPHHIPPLIRACASHFQQGAVVSDICGVKTGLYQTLAPLIPDTIDYVGAHPMAGRERDGFENACPTLYRGSGFLITPLPKSKPSGIALLRELADHIGAARIEVIDPAHHDRIIAYTSDLMHIAAAGLCLDFHPDMTLAYTAGAFRDCTRIADINPDAWRELLLANRDNTLEALDAYIEDLRRMRGAIARRDGATLAGLLAQAGDNKREMQGR
ncbi:MAG: prephenate dehydrogenase/arogenate dehydrogenase family protein [Oscillospiraceae bacterium]|nr:prephenate dehydrogenase/arogenate dehydrogenase family protein [Oscillospiraceae bacterium]